MQLHQKSPNSTNSQWEGVLGLLQARVEGNLLGPKTADNVMTGKSYDKGIRAHKIPLQSMWRILIPQLLSFLEDQNPDLKEQYWTRQRMALQKVL